MNKVVPWQALVALIQPHARGAHQALGGRSPFAVETMLRIHCLQLWWNLSDPAMEEELHERPLYRRFVGLDGAARLPDVNAGQDFPTTDAGKSLTNIQHQTDRPLRSGLCRSPVWSLRRHRTD
jgi:hypothetical protein